ncbi:MAG: hybrid sensor histidine kinase/response regulator [Verrucomicrobiae bacterium]|nr:hybrid sensor histidine kinase/response regulator [Verrucomicrobiae bacterium]
MQPHRDDLQHLSMLELFRVEAEHQTALLTAGLLEVERGHASAEQLDALMRAAHSLKGAARIVNLHAAVRVAHAMEDCLVAAQHGEVTLDQPLIDVLLRGVDLFQHIARGDEHTIAAWESAHATEIRAFLDDLSAMLSGRAARGAKLEPSSRAKPAPGARSAGKSESRSRRAPAVDSTAAERPADTGAPSAAGQRVAPVAGPNERVLRLTAENLNRLLGLAGESLVESRWLRPFAEAMLRLKRAQGGLEEVVERLRQELEGHARSERLEDLLAGLVTRAAEVREGLNERLRELDAYDRRFANLAHRLYLEVLRTRMRPFAEGTQRFPRMVRDLARAMGKQVRLEILGAETQVDRDLLERLETPLAHLLRNAVDHGCERPEERLRAGKPAEALIRLEARHVAGQLQITVSDDGAGIDLERVRREVLARQLAPPTLAEELTEGELVQFLFLPGFTLKDRVTEISGRGVGLDIVQNLVKSVRGSVRVMTRPGAGTKFVLQLPLTLSVLRALLVEIGGEPYAIPLTRIAHTFRLAPDTLETLEGRLHFRWGGQAIGLLAAQQVLECGDKPVSGDELSVVVLSDGRRGGVGACGPEAVSSHDTDSFRRRAGGARPAFYGLIVDRFLGERELVVQSLDPRLGKVRDISAAAITEEGHPVLIVDVDDLLCSIEKLLASGAPVVVQRAALLPPPRRRKRVLAVDDSLTVRELQRKLLVSRGYLADVAVDGMDAWNAVRSGVYDLVITDVDMPRMDGIELTTLIKQDPRLKSLPVLIVSYKDREEERLRGLNAGADYYLTKSGFHDEKLIEAVMDLIGEPEG